jgi:hypothetical protein
MSNLLPPRDLAKNGRGRRLWREVVAVLDLDGRDVALLHEAGRLLDRLDALDTAVRESGPLLPDGRVVPALVESRQGALALARVLAAMRLPEDLANPVVRPQRRGGVRGPYAFHPPKEAVG